MKTIVLHDYFRFLDGGGRLSLILAQAFETDLGYGFKVKNHPYFNAYTITGREYDLGVFGYVTGWRNIRLIQSFKQKTGFLKRYHTAVYSGFYAPLAVDHHCGGKNIYYCHTPPRYIYDQQDFYLSRLPLWLHPITHALAGYHKTHYEAAVKKMDRIVTNSYNVKRRIAKFLGLDATVVYPPCEIDHYQWIGQEGYYLSAARLDPLKRVDVIVNAFKKMPTKQLVVISDGPEINKLRKSAENHRNIKVLGRVSDRLYRRLIGECIATIYIPKDEDFGMAPIESMAAGKPVISVCEGGMTESLQHDITGILLAPPPKEEDIVEAVKELDRKKAREMMPRCQTRARAFSAETFISKMSAILD
jgi:glycosyltransferase involved in cell wall biosynthesis